MDTETTADERSKLLEFTAQLNKRFNCLWDARVSWESKWRDAVNHVDPTMGRFVTTDSAKGDKGRSKIVDGVATRSLRIAQAGLLAGMASPARPWFQLQSGDRALDELQDVREWSEEFRDAILRVYERTNTYQGLGSLFGQELVVATGAMMVFDDPEKVIRTQVFPIGCYAVGQSPEGEVDQFVREFVMTVEQAADAYGLERLSEGSQNAMREKSYQAPITIRHAIWRRRDHDTSVIGPRRFAWGEWYWEWMGATSGAHGETPMRGNQAAGSHGGVLKESGYEEFPVIVARWAKNDDDPYGTSCPTFDCLGDIKELQAEKRAHGRALGKIIDPPLKASPALEGRPLSLMAGDVTYDSGVDGGKGVSPIHEVRWSVGEVLDSMERLHVAIREAYMIPIWQMLLGDARSQPPTAEEIRARSQEKADILGPILERHSDDVFDKLIERTAAIMLRRSLAAWKMGEPGLVPQPPPALEGKQLRPVYISEVAMAQRLAGLAPLERHVQFAGAYAGIDPTVLDRLDGDEILEEHRRIVGVPSKMHNTDEDTEAIRAQRAAQQQAQMAAAAAPGLAKAAKDLSQTNTTADSALRRVLAPTGT